MLKKINCLVAEVNLIQNDVLEKLVSTIENINIYATCKTGQEAASILKEKEMDIVFCDVKMPLLNDNELLENLDRPPVFILIKSQLELATERFGLNVIGFIEKPVKLQCLINATTKAVDCLEFRKTIFSGYNKMDLPALPKNNFQLEKKDYFFFKEDSDYKRIDNNNVLFLESMGNFSCIHTLEKGKHITLVNLKHIEEQLPFTQFMRVHRRYIINLDHIISLTSDGNVHLKKNIVIPLGSIYKAELMKIINNNLLLRQ